jgi:hypothetical protein
MVEKALVEESVVAGEVLTRRLVDAKFPLVASFWLYSEESGRWRLTLASSLVDQRDKGPLKAYEQIQKLIRNDPALRSLTLSDISVVSPRDDIVRALRTVLGPAANVNGVRLGGTRISDLIVEGAYLYRLSPLRRSHSSKSLTATKSERRSTHTIPAASG